MKQEVTIYEIEDLKKLSKEINIWGSKTRNIKINFPFLSSSDNINIEERVNKLYATCGCEQGRVAGILTFIGYLLLILTGFISISQLGIFKTIVLYFLFSFVTMSIAKIIKLQQARAEFSHLIKSLESMSFS